MDIFPFRGAVAVYATPGDSPFVIASLVLYPEVVEMKIDDNCFTKEVQPISTVDHIASQREFRFLHNVTFEKSGQLLLSRRISEVSNINSAAFCSINGR